LIELSPKLNTLTPYIPGEQPKNLEEFIKLNTNENPYPPSKNVDNLLKTFEVDNLRLYPPPHLEDLREVIGSFYGVSGENVFVGNGSDEVLGFSFFAFFYGKKKKILIPEISYSFYPVFARLFDIEFEEIPLREDFSIDLDIFLEKSSICGGIVFANPNAPTSLGIDSKRLEAFLESLDPNIPVIVDEAYMDFYGDSIVNLVKRFKNLLVVRTFSKSFALAGIRFGFAIGDSFLIDSLFKVRDSFNSYTINMLTYEIAKSVFEDIDYYNEIVSKIIKTRERVKNSLKEMGLEVFDSKTNFLFIRIDKEKFNIDAENVYLKLKENKILVRYFNSPEKIKDFIRVTIGKDEEMDIFLEKLGGILGAFKG